MKAISKDLQREQYIKMTETPVKKLVVTLAIPTTISMLITSIYNLADSYFVGQINTMASAAVGVVMGLMTIIQAFGFMLGHGAGSVVARMLGQKKPEEATDYASVSFFTSIILGVAIAVLGLKFNTSLMYGLGSSETVLPYSSVYSGYILLAAPFMTGGCVLNNILRYEGKAALAMVGLTLGGVLNIGLDAFTMMVLKMGVHGAGLSTAISQVISFIVLLSVFLMGKTQSKLKLERFAKCLPLLCTVIVTGLPSLVRQGLGSFATIMLNNYAKDYGDAAIAAMSIVTRISMFIFCFGLGIGQGFQPVCAFNYGAGKYKRVRQSYYFTMVAAEFFLGSLALIGLVFSNDLIRIFRNDPKVIEIGTFALRFHLMALFFHPVIVCTNMLFQSIGKSVRATFVSTLRSGLCFIPVIMVLRRCMGLTGIQISQPAADAISFIIAAVFAVTYMRELPTKDSDGV
ncbi:MAG: MATE family efflux transporter [Lachnospiraceae bacterium]|nr:MATE family efflux transporter [Lachnospiraceae bacterium]